MNRPKISIIIPVYNVEKYLRECLDSCVNQTLEDIEIICVDDCSLDNSIKILEEYQAKDSRIKILRHEINKNLGAARNTGLANATGEYIWFVDSDDYIDTKACQILYDAIKEFNVDILCFTALQFSEQDSVQTFHYSSFFQGIQINKIYHPKTNWKEIQFSNLNVSACMYLTKRAFIHNFGFRENVWHEDVDFTPILLVSANSFCFIPYSAYFRRRNPSSITQTAISQKRLEDLIKALESLNDFAANNKIKKDHFLYRYTIWMTLYITRIRESNTSLNPSNLNDFFKLKKKYRVQKYSLKRFIRKILQRI
ncbi:glycosyltransferase family 2 protein [bacterium]|nr:glycosyltransferase family 2 protein [bacterium]